MKKITKKAYNEAANYMIAIDYCAGKERKHGMVGSQVWQTIGLKAGNILEAMAETEGYWNEDVYMIHLLEKVGKTENAICYKAVLATRTKGNFHRHDRNHGEQPDMGFEVDPEETERFGFTYAEYTTKELNF